MIGTFCHDKWCICPPFSKAILLVGWNGDCLSKDKVLSLSTSFKLFHILSIMKQMKSCSLIGIILIFNATKSGNDRSFPYVQLPSFQCSIIINIQWMPIWDWIMCLGIKYYVVFRNEPCAGKVPCCVPPTVMPSYCSELPLPHCSTAFVEA